MPGIDGFSTVSGPGGAEFEDADVAATSEAAAAAPAVDAAKTEKDVDTLYKAMKGLGTDEDKVFEVLESRNVPERAAIETRFDDKYKRVWPSLRAALADEMSNEELGRATRALDAGKDPVSRKEIMTDFGKGGGFARGVHHLGTWFTFGHGDAKAAAADGCPRIRGQEARDLIPQLKPGDVILCGNAGNVTHAIVYAGGGKIIHSMASKETMRTWGERTGDLLRAPLDNVLEDAGKKQSKQGVIEEGLDEFFDRFERDTYVVMRSPNLTPDKAEKGLADIKKLVGKDYDWDFAPGNDSYYCTEIAGAFLRGALGDEAPRIGARPVKHGIALNREAVVDPLDVLASPDLKPVLSNDAAKNGKLKDELAKKRDV